MSFHSLRAANHALYLGATLLVVTACACTLWQGERPAWQLVMIAAAALLTLIWGSCYTLLRYQVDAKGVSRTRFFVTRRILWEELDRVEHEEEHSPGTTRMTLRFHARNGHCLTLSSDLLSLDALEELTAELRSKGYLPAAPGEDPPSS